MAAGSATLLLPLVLAFALSAYGTAEGNELSHREVSAWLTSGPRTGRIARGARAGSSSGGSRTSKTGSTSTGGRRASDAGQSSAGGSATGQKVKATTSKALPARDTTAPSSTGRRRTTTTRKTTTTTSTTTTTTTARAPSSTAATSASSPALALSTTLQLPVYNSTSTPTSAADSSEFA
ncbi:integumentary mucin C.1-like isoform X2 [Schistocerca americana]|uniref:integumentary mucin C.1-like isoform X2 n=1 Tax=Schistocerca americana TaxID=7009 RepID=UPI001F4FF729|nr:integumentary mucin C.1-like isoform X2 [Schistocerca americana]